MSSKVLLNRKLYVPKEICTAFVEGFFFYESLAVDLTISTVGLAPRSHVRSYNTTGFARYICILY